MQLSSWPGPVRPSRPYPFDSDLVQAEEPPTATWLPSATAGPPGKPSRLAGEGNVFVFKGAHKLRPPFAGPVVASGRPWAGPAGNLKAFRLIQAGRTRKGHCPSLPGPAAPGVRFGCQCSAEAIVWAIAADSLAWSWPLGRSSRGSTMARTLYTSPLPMGLYWDLSMRIETRTGGLDKPAVRDSHCRVPRI